MNYLVKQIREAFFNPILYFLPTLVFLIGNEFRGVEYGVSISFPIAFVLVFYIYFAYKRVFFWHGLFATFYLFLVFITSLISDSYLLQKLVAKLIFIIFLLIVILSKNKLSKIASQTVRYNLPMSTNENELVKMSKVLLSITLAYFAVCLLSNAFLSKLPANFDFILKNIYAFALVFVAVTYTLFTISIRKKLEQEEWLPIVNEQGGVIGSVQYQESAKSDARLLHPVLRFYYIQNNKIFLQQRKPDDRHEAMCWDASLSRKLRMTESVQSVLKDRSIKLYSKEPESVSFLTNYIYRGEFCDNYIYLYISCRCDNLQPQKDEVYATKWWTVKQIESELGSGLFSERFEIEYEMLKRTGILQEEFKCNCDCRLRETVYKNILSSDEE